MLRATAKVRQIAERMEKYRWDIPSQIKRMKRDPSLYVRCRDFKEYRGLVFELACQDVLKGISLDPEAQIEPITGDIQANCLTPDRTGSQEYGPVCLSGNAMFSRKREYDSVVKINGVPTVFEATTSSLKVRKLTDPTEIITRLKPLEDRLEQEVAYAIVTIVSSFSGSDSISLDVRKSIYDFMRKGGVVVRAPFVYQEFKDEVMGRILEAGFPVHLDLPEPQPAYSWMVDRPRRPTGKDSYKASIPHKHSEIDARVKKFLESEGRRLGFA